MDEVSFDIVPEEQVTAVRNTIARIYARTDATLTAFRFSGPQAVATARKATQQGGFTLVELSRDTWTRGEDGWELTEHVPLSRGYETAAPDPETVRAVAEDLKQFAVPLNGLEPFRTSAGCVAIHRTDLADGSGEQVLSAAGIPQWVLDLRKVPGQQRPGPLAGRAASVSRTAGHTIEELRLAGVPGSQPGIEKLRPHQISRNVSRRLTASSGMGSRFSTIWIIVVVKGQNIDPLPSPRSSRSISTGSAVDPSCLPSLLYP